MDRSDDGAGTWSAAREVSLAPPGSNNLFPALAARGDGDVRIAWMDDRNGFDPGADDPSARWNVYYRSSTNAGATWSAEAKLSQYVSGYSYKYATPKDGFAEPYGDYFELDIDGAGQTHAIWGEGPSYVGPGNVWLRNGPVADPPVGRPSMGDGCQRSDDCPPRTSASTPSALNWLWR